MSEHVAEGRAAGAVYVTTSWDDGHVLDHRLAGLLEEYGVPGTFYVAPMNVELPRQERLRARDMRALAADFEIGGHTLNHIRLTTLDDDAALEEIVSGKDRLEQIVGHELRSFCYPGGEYSERHVGMVRDAGFSLARTVRRGVTGLSPQYETHTTVNAYRHLVDGPAALRLARGDWTMASRLFWNWDELAILLFDRVLTVGGVFHLWGHSWEVDRNGDWSRLERVLSHIGGRKNVNYVDNGSLKGLSA